MVVLSSVSRTVSIGAPRGKPDDDGQRLLSLPGLFPSVDHRITARVIRAPIKETHRLFSRDLNIPIALIDFAETNLSRHTPLLLAIAILCGVTTTLATPATDSSTPRVAIVYGAAATYRAAVDALERKLKRNQVRIRTFELPDDSTARQELLQELRDFGPHVIASGGAVSTQFVHQALPDIPLTYFMVPNPLDLKVGKRGRKPIAGTSSDISPREQCAWIKKTSPRVRRLAILYSERTQATVASFVQAGRSAGLEIVGIRSSREDFMHSIETLTAENVDGVLMLPDAAVYSAKSVQRLLVWGIREKKPIWSFSAKLVEAGAFASMHPDVAAVGATTAQRVLKLARGERVTSRFEYAPKAKYAINLRTADLIGTTDGLNRLAMNVVRFGEAQ